MFCEGCVAAAETAASSEAGLLIPTWVLATATIMLFFYTARLFGATRSLVEEERETRRRELRAYMSAAPLRISVTDDPRTYALHIIMKNHGQTPAYNVVPLSNASIKQYPMLGPLNLSPEIQPNNPAPKFVVFPNAEHKIAQKITITEEDEARVTQGHYALYVYGRITYEDAFGETQWTEFCSAIASPQLNADLFRASVEPVHAAVEAGFKFTPFNNDSSKNVPVRKSWWQRTFG